MTLNLDYFKVKDKNYEPINRRMKFKFINSVTNLSTKNVEKLSSDNESKYARNFRRKMNKLKSDYDSNNDCFSLLSTKDTMFPASKVLSRKSYSKSVLTNPRSGLMSPMSCMSENEEENKTDFGKLINQIKKVTYKSQFDKQTGRQPLYDVPNNCIPYDKIYANDEPGDDMIDVRINTCISTKFTPIRKIADHYAKSSTNFNQLKTTIGRIGMNFTNDTKKFNLITDFAKTYDFYNKILNHVYDNKMYDRDVRAYFRNMRAKEYPDFKVIELASSFHNALKDSKSYHALTATNHKFLKSIYKIFYNDTPPKDISIFTPRLISSIYTITIMNNDTKYTEVPVETRRVYDAIAVQKRLLKQEEKDLRRTIKSNFSKLNLISNKKRRLIRILAYRADKDYEQATRVMINNIEEWMVNEFNNMNLKSEFKPAYLVINCLKFKNDDFPNLYSKYLTDEPGYIYNPIYLTINSLRNLLLDWVDIFSNSKWTNDLHDHVNCRWRYIKEVFYKYSLLKTMSEEENEMFLLLGEIYYNYYIIYGRKQHNFIPEM